jgi:hypothetical protein
MPTNTLTPGLQIEGTFRAHRVPLLVAVDNRL